MKILLFGATGRTGRAVLNTALEAGHEVVALVRNPARLSLREHPRLTVVEGDPADASVVSRALSGCAAVISTLNNNRASDAPWSKPVSPPGFMTGVMRNCVAAMKEQGVSRIAVLSAAGVGDSFAHVPWLFRWFIRHTNLGHTYRDHETQERVLAESGLEWTIARPVGLSDKPTKRSLAMAFGEPEGTSMTIQRGHVARFLVDCLQDPMLIGKAAFLYEK